VISHALGHTNPNTTLVYIREIDDQRVKEANELIINSIGNATDNTPNEET
jgi:integrase